MRASLPAVRRWWLLLGVGIILSVPMLGRPQGQIGNKDALQKAFDDNFQRRNRLFTGDDQPGKADLKLAEAAANWYIFRITYKSFEHAKVQTDFANQVNAASNKPNNKAFVNMFGQALVKSMQEVLTRDIKDDPTTVINAAMMLPTMAKLKQDDVGVYLMSLINDPKTHDAVRLYALKAMKEYMPIRIQSDDEDFADKNINARRGRDKAHVEALTKYIERLVAVAGKSGEEVGAVYFLRREAITSLASAGAPAVNALKKPEKKEGLVAPTLMKVLAQDVLLPPPSLQEKVEAAIGLCQMKYPNMPEYHPELAVYLIGTTIGEFVGEYKKDYENFAVKSKDRKLPFVSWKADAKRLELALGDLVTNAKGTSANGNANTLKNDAIPILKKIYQYDQPEKDGQFRNQIVPKLRPSNGAVFKNLKLVEIPLPKSGG